uniref:Uncharacterized protein n=1 Tax=Cacopsylla melanoneura TaxID=428564 RepID=A0A8D8RKJ1_9HEMI
MVRPSILISHGAPGARNSSKISFTLVAILDCELCRNSFTINQKRMFSCEYSLRRYVVNSARPVGSLMRSSMESAHRRTRLSVGTSTSGLLSNQYCVSSLFQGLEGLGVVKKASYSEYVSLNRTRDSTTREVFVRVLSRQDFRKSNSFLRSSTLLFFRCPVPPRIHVGIGSSELVNPGGGLCTRQYARS